MNKKSQQRTVANGRPPVPAIRHAQMVDVDAIVDIYNEAVGSTTATFDTEPQTKDERLRWLESHDERHPVMVAELDSQVVGWAALTKWSARPAYDHTVESSFYVGERFRGRGVGRALKLRLIEEARSLGHHTIIARVAEGNAASIHLNESTGFQRIGTMKEVGLKFGQRLDVHLMQLMLEQTHEEDVGKLGDEAITVVESLTAKQSEQLHELLNEQWWGGRRTFEDVQRMVENTSLLLGLVERDSARLVAFCRVLTDFSFRATIYDVMVVEDWKGRGLGTRLMDTLSKHPKLEQVSLIYLACEPQLYSFYEKWGFKVYDERAKWMVKIQCDE